MNDPTDTASIVHLEHVKRENNHHKWIERCKKRFEERFPSISFEADFWPLRDAHKTRMANIRFEPVLNLFEGKHESFGTVVRGLISELAIKDELKTVHRPSKALRLLADIDAPTVWSLQVEHLRAIEAICLEKTRSDPTSASTLLSYLRSLQTWIDRLAQLGIVERMYWVVGTMTRRKLELLEVENRNSFRSRKAGILDRQIEALSDAMTVMFQGDERLSCCDRTALAVMGLQMCAPSRVNEVLCLSVDDHVTLADYVKRPEERETDILHSAHQLLITMKGSKGADWGAKPVLNFMIGLFNHCLNELIDSGKRSRMLAQWYEENPAQLYLPPELEHLRGQDIDRRRLWQIMNLSGDSEVDSSQTALVKWVWLALKAAGKVKRIPNPKSINVAGAKNSRTTVEAAAWPDVEAELLHRVHQAMANVRRVTLYNHYEGSLSKMLALFDFKETPYLPASLKYNTLARRLKQSVRNRQWYREERGSDLEPTIFEKLGITMPVDGKEVYAYLETHDPRRWLTTQAMLARERLSDVLINKWANRLNIDQLKHYDLRTDVQKADQAAMPEVRELTDISRGLMEMQQNEKAYGLQTEIVAAHGAGVSISSMDAILSATEDRPVAKTSNQLIILYPTKYGACLHQHHESPCRAYDRCTLCDDSIVVKGHLPTNDEMRRRADAVFKSIVNQLDRLSIAHNRGIADCPEGLESHMLSLVAQGLNAKEIASELIDRCHEIKESIKNVAFRNKLEEAFVTRGLTRRLDDGTVASGALIKYHNPTRHASPGHERAIEAHGGRDLIEQRRREFEARFPQFAPTRLDINSEGRRTEVHELYDDEAEDDEE